MLNNKKSSKNVYINFSSNAKLQGTIFTFVKLIIKHKDPFLEILY